MNGTRRTSASVAARSSIGVTATRTRARVMRAPSVGAGARRIGQRQVDGGRELRIQAHDLGVPQHLLVPPQRPSGERMGEGLALAEDHVLLSDLGAVLGGDVEEDLGALQRDHDGLHRLEGLDEVAGHEREGGGDPVGDTGARRRRHRQQHGQHRRPVRPRASKRHRGLVHAEHRAQALADLAERRRGLDGLHQAAASGCRGRGRPSPARPAPARPGRRRASRADGPARSTSASPTPASSWKRLDGGDLVGDELVHADHDRAPCPRPRAATGRRRPGSRAA